MLLDERSSSLSGQVLHIGGNLVKLISYLSEKWKGIETPFLVYEKELFLKIYLIKNYLI